MSAKPSCDYTIHTIASVGRIKWRPQKKYHIASCALVVDCSINVWDIRRPYIPFASFNEHKDIPTGVAWRSNPQSFLSTSRVILFFFISVLPFSGYTCVIMSHLSMLSQLQDCTLYHHVFEDATKPSSKANPQGIALSPNSDIAYACKVNVNVTTPAKQLSNIMR